MGTLDSLDLRERMAAGFVVAFLAAQLLLPTGVLIGGETDRFGWRMFARSVRAPVVVAVYGDGTEQTLELEDLTRVRRADVPYQRYLGPYLCRDPRVEEVRVRTGSEEVVHRCRS